MRPKQNFFVFADGFLSFERLKVVLLVIFKAARMHFSLSVTNGAATECDRRSGV